MNTPTNEQIEQVITHTHLLLSFESAFIHQSAYNFQEDVTYPQQLARYMKKIGWIRTAAGLWRYNPTAASEKHPSVVKCVLNTLLGDSPIPQQTNSIDTVIKQDVDLNQAMRLVAEQVIKIKLPSKIMMQKLVEQIVSQIYLTPAKRDVYKILRKDTDGTR